MKENASLMKKELICWMPVVIPDIMEYRLTFGKYTGLTLIEVYDRNPGYIDWARKNITTEPLRTLLHRFEVNE